MDVKKLCHVCNRLAVRTCRICGRPVCGRHVGASGVCSSCALGRS